MVGIILDDKRLVKASKVIKDGVVFIKDGKLYFTNGYFMITKDVDLEDYVGKPLKGDGVIVLKSLDVRDAKYDLDRCVELANQHLKGQKVLSDWYEYDNQYYLSYLLYKIAQNKCFVIRLEEFLKLVKVFKDMSVDLFIAPMLYKTDEYKLVILKFHDYGECYYLHTMAKVDKGGE